MVKICLVVVMIKKKKNIDWSLEMGYKQSDTAQPYSHHDHLSNHKGPSMFEKMISAVIFLLRTVSQVSK